MVRCWVQGCPSYSGGGKTRFFGMPKKLAPDLVTKWKQNLSRRNRKFNEKDSSMRICEKHFLPEAIVKNYTYVINGEKVYLPRGKWKLAVDAVPTVLLPAMPKNFTWEVIGHKGRKGKKGKKPDPKQAVCPPSSPQMASEQEELLPPMEDVPLNNSKQTANNPGFTLAVLEEERLTEDPRTSDWIFQVLQEKDCAVAYFISLASEGKAVINKQIRIFQTMEFQVFFADTDVTTFFASEKQQLALQSMSDVRQLLEIVSKNRLCSGLEGFSKISSYISGHKVNDKWFSRSCDVVGVCKVCIPCKRLYMCLLKIECSSKAASECPSDQNASPSSV